MKRPLLLIGVLVTLVMAAVAVTVGFAVVGALKRDHGPLLAATTEMDAQLMRQALTADAQGTAGVADIDEHARAFELALAQAIAETPPRSRERRLLVAQGDVAARWRTLTLSDMTAPQAVRDRFAARRDVLLDQFAAIGRDVRAHVMRSEAAADRRVRRAVLLLLLGFGAIILSIGGILGGNAWRRHALRAAKVRRQMLDDQRHRIEQQEFTRALQGARTEREAQRMLKRQLERTLSEATATVLNRNNSDNRLQAVTAIRPDSPLADTLPDAEPADCLAVRFGQTHERGAGSNPLLSCELCGGIPGSVTCLPSLVGGEVIGSVLIESPESLDDGGRQRFAEAVAYAAPVLSSMRNLRLAETRASTDVLTGLPNRRSAEESLKRILAQADRSGSPCAVAMFDLDHFKKVNDVYGHEKGDQLLATVGAATTTSSRASDFAARFGGEEFLLVLPDTNLDGAMVACEKLRSAIADIRLPGLGANPSASFGVAVFPEDGVEPEVLLRGADRALYAAKSAGRNCIKALRALEPEVATPVRVVGAGAAAA